MPHFQSENATVRYEVVGSGPPILLIAGIASDGASWAPLVPLLKDFQLIVIDNRGSGQTRFNGTINVADMVFDCAQLLDHLKVPKAHVVGHSLGGMIAHRVATLYPGKVDRMVTMCCSSAIGAKERVLFKDLARIYPRVEPFLWYRLLFQWLFAAPSFFTDEAIAAAAGASAAYANRQNPKDFARQVEAIDRMRPAIIEAIRCPVLAIAAEKDLLVPPAAVAAGHVGVAKLETLMIEGAGHSVHWEAPEKVAAAIRGFFTRQD